MSEKAGTLDAVIRRHNLSIALKPSETLVKPCVCSELFEPCDRRILAANVSKSKRHSLTAVAKNRKVSEASQPVAKAFRSA